ncbi:unnamed protein product [Orchesella dallaii]|uniref:RNA-directed DNA polymerase n=1 Tax=Orchesella dallaii TaxID=48710 RepID=A0ABP1RTF0_9HEXA
MEESGVIKRIDHSEWASPLVVVPKPNGKMRITGDFKRTTNNQLCVNQYPLARVEDLFETIAGGETFSKLDGTDAFHQIELDEASKKFMVINTHRGLYRYNVLPQGIASSPAIFQEMMDTMLRGIPNCGSFVDDGICSGKSNDLHIKNLKTILARMRDWNYKLSRDKCEFFKPSLKFLGQIVCSEGIRTDPCKVEAIMSMRAPKDVGEIKSFLGLVTFYAKFIPNLSTVVEPLNELTRSEVKWSWSQKCQTAFDHVKKLVSSSPILAHFTQGLPIGLSCDASSVGLGAVLFHNNEDGSEVPIAFASKSLSKAERNYSQVEKEGLAIVFGVKRFMQYLYGRRFTLVTDHNPLLTIFGRNRDMPSLAANRLHRWALFLSSYDFDIKYRNTNNHGNADALSRLPMEDQTPTDEETEVFVKQILQQHPVTSKKVKQFTSRDPVLSVIIRHIQSGWPAKANQLPEPVRPYFAHRNEYTVEQGTILWGLRVVVPAALQASVLQQLHETHPGVVRMKSIARQYVWWPGVDNDIENLVEACTSCAVNKDNPAEAPLHPWSYPEKPWQRLHLDLAGPFKNNMWLIIVDAYSKWPEVYKMGKETTSSKIISCVRESFCRFGIPETIVTDNGPQFVSREFEKFCVDNGVRHTTSSAYHPRSNGEAERFIRTFKNAMNRSTEADLTLCLCQFLITYRSTPHATTDAAPAELLMKRNIRTLFDLIRPDVNSKVRKNQEKSKEQFDNKTPLREFQPGQQVWVQSFSKGQPTWSLGRVKQATGPVSYQVEVEGRIMKRHVDHMLCGEAATVRESDKPPSCPPTAVNSPVLIPTPSPCSTIVMPSPVVPGSPEATPPAIVPDPVAVETPTSSQQQQGRRYETRPNRKPPIRLQYN